MRFSRNRFLVLITLVIALLTIAPGVSVAGQDDLHFATLGPHASLPSGSWCAGQIAATAENVPANTPFNQTRPRPDQLAQFYPHPVSTGPPASDFSRVDGNYTGSTDMILRWAACKWGIDENVVRAQAWTESKWKQGGSDPAVGGGDRRFGLRDCVRGSFTALWNFACPGCCYQSWGILQTKVFYEAATWPMIKDSTAFNADYRYADQRACMNGDYAGYFMSAAQRPNTYLSDTQYGDINRILWGCIGMHFSGSWYDASAEKYVAEVRTHLAAQPWRYRSQD